MNLKHTKRSEDTEQIHVIQWAGYRTDEFPELKWLHHVPNGGSRDKREAVKLKWMGVKSGVSDLHLPIPKGEYIGLWIEMKYANGRVQESQKEFLADMEEVGHFVATCYSADEAITTISAYCKLPKGEKMPFENNSVLKNGKIERKK
jgi:hypothetical protein